MTSLFAPPEILSAYAFAEDGSDQDLPPGTHLRLFTGLGASFPLAPFAVFKLTSQFNEPSRVWVTDREDRPVDNFDLAQLGIAEATLVLRDSDTQRTVRVELEDPEGGVAGVMLLGQKNKRPIAIRDKPRWLFSAPVMNKLLAWGSSTHPGFRVKSVDIDTILEEHHELVEVLGLPVDGSHLWYIGVQSRDDGLQRAKRGAPLRLNPMDRPDGPLAQVSPNDEVARVEAMLQTGLAGGLEDLLSRLIDDPANPWEQIEKEEMLAPDGKKQFVRAPRLGTMQMAALDPGLARFFGFADRIDDFPDLESAGGWDTLAVVGLFAIDPKAYDYRGLDLTPLLEPDEFAGRLLEILIRALEETSGQEVHGRIEDLIAQVRGMGLAAAPLVAVVSPVPPWRPPALAKPQIVQRRWQAATGGSPSSLYRAGFAFPGAPLASLTALAAQLEGSLVARHDTVEVGGHQPPVRAKPQIFGHEQESGSRLRKYIQASPVFEPAGLLSDQDIPAAASPITYRVRASDFFGRFGSPVDFMVEPPPRPAPPSPVLRFYFERAKLSADDLASLDELSPGVLKLTVAVPRPKPADRFTADEKERLGSVIVVPRIDDLAAGSLHLASLELRFGDREKSVDLSTSGFFEVEFPLLGLKPQEPKIWTLMGCFKNTAGVESEPASLPVLVTDARPPKALPTGIGLFWTSAPGPSPEVELKLSWPAEEGTQHRVYLTDQQGLGLTADNVREPSPEAPPSRGRVAAVGCKKVLNRHPIDRKAFRLLTEQSIEAGPDGRAVLEARLPRSLSTVQFLRVVPLGPDGAEPPFEDCGIVPVAVPDSRRPAAPRLEGAVDPATGAARLQIVADGFDRVTLERDEPGLFTAGAEGNEPPQFRIRRAVGAVADPIYARPIDHGPLALEDAATSTPIFSATVTDGNAGRGLEPFVRYVYWAEVRLPPERTLPADLNRLDPPGGITAVDPANAESYPRPMSLPSAPRVLMHVPPHAPAAPPPEAITVTRRPTNAAGNVEVEIEIADPPRAHTSAIGSYRLAVWSQWPGQGIQPITNANDGMLEGTWPDVSGGTISVSLNLPASVDPASPLTLRLGFVDPIGRLSKLISFDVPPP